MCDKHWEALAEIYIADKNSSDPDDYICCLCSRIYIRTPETRTILASEDASEGEDIDGDCVGEMVDLGKGSGMEIQSIEKHDEEPVSCYCSASHTDNNYSTDEHDSVRDSAHWPAAHSLTQKLGLHQSDSGADLSEYHDQHEAKSIQNLVASYGKTFQTAETMIENNYESVDATEYKCVSGDKESMVQSLSDSTTISNKETHDKDSTSYMQCESDSYTYPYSAYYGSNKSAMDMEWGKFWAKHGEQVIWKSWLEKYADYINPDYFQNNSAVENRKSQDMEIDEVVVDKYFEQNTCFPNQAHKNCELVHSNFAGIFVQNNINDSELKPAAVSSSNSFLFDQLNIQEINDRDADESRKKMINFEMSQGNGDGWNPLSPLSAEETYNQHSNAEDERLLTRCDSINGSIAKTNATSDSMTNVTKMTLTSSSCDSNSVHSSSLITSVTSSIESSITSSSSDQENEYNMEDNERCWQYLWKENFQTQYQKHYEIFIANYQKERNINDYLDKPTELPASFDPFVENPENENEMFNLERNETYLQVPSAYESDAWKNDKNTVPVKQDDKNTISVKKANKNMRKNSKSKGCSEKETDMRILSSVGMLLKNLAIKAKELIEDADEKIHEDQLEITKMETVPSTISNNQQDSSNEGDKLHDEVHQPSCSGNSEEDTSESDGLESVRRAFSQMKYGAVIEDESQRNMQGEVVYRKRNIKRYTSNGYNNSQLMAEIKQWKNARSNGVLKDAAEKIIEDTAFELKKYLSHPSSISTDDVQHNDKGSYTKTQATSSSDDEDSIRNMQKKKKKKQFRKQNKTIPKEIANDRRLFKFYIRRHGLFSKYDEGIKLDHESWYSVTPEEIAKNTAKRCRCDTIIDAFCGAGSNSIQFAFTCERVIAIDIDPNKIQNARHNARIYGVEDRIEFIVGDFMKLAPSLVADVVFLSPPWGGLDYRKERVFKLESIMPPIGGKNVFEAARKITEHIAYYLPRNTDAIQMTLMAGQYGTVELEQNIFNGRFTACTAYYGELARPI